MFFKQFLSPQMLDLTWRRNVASPRNAINFFIMMTFLTTSKEEKQRVSILSPILWWQTRHGSNRYQAPL